MTDAEIAAERLTALLDAERENTVLRREVSYLRACVPPTRPTDYGHEVWTAALVEAKKEGARSAVAERVAVTPEPAPARPLTNDDLARAYDMGRDMERADTVAWLREAPALRHYADCIERGEHRRSPSSRPARPRIDPLALPCPACAAPVREPCGDMPPDAYCYARVEEADGGGVPINPETSK